MCVLKSGVLAFVRGRETGDEVERMIADKSRRRIDVPSSIYRRAVHMTENRLGNDLWLYRLEDALKCYKYICSVRMLILR